MYKNRVEDNIVFRGISTCTVGWSEKELTSAQESFDNPWESISTRHTSKVSGLASRRIILRLAVDEYASSSRDKRDREKK